MKQYFDKTSCRNICMYNCYAHTKIQLNPISNCSDICKRNFKMRAIAKPIPVYRGWVKTVRNVLEPKEVNEIFAVKHTILLI